MKFNEWISRKYIEWRGEAYGRQKTVKEFAEYIGVSQPLMSQWMKPNGHIPRNQDTISKLVARYGVEVYDILNLPQPDPLQSELDKKFSQMTPAERKEAIQKINEIIARRQQQDGQVKPGTELLQSKTSQE